MKAFSSPLIASLALLVAVLGQTYAFPYTGLYQPLTSAALVAAGTPQLNTIPQAQTTNIATQSLYSSPTSALVTGVRPDGTYNYGYQTPDGQLVSINYIAGQQSAIPVVTTGTAPAPAAATNTATTLTGWPGVAATNTAATTLTGWPGVGATNTAAATYTGWPTVSTQQVNPSWWVLPQQTNTLAQQSAALTAPAPAPAPSSHSIAEQLAAALTQQQQQQYQTVPLGLSQGTNPQWQTVLG